MSMRRAEQIVAIHGRAILEQTGAGLVMAGTKSKNGRDTGEPAVVVAVANKRPLADIPPAQRVPPAMDGLRTDVIQRWRPHARPRIGRFCLSEWPIGCDRPVERHRPLIGGVSMFHDRWPWAADAVGTLGAIVRDASPNGGGRLVGLTNNHCLGMAYNPSYGVPWFGENDDSRVVVHQPAVPDTGHPERDRIGTALRRVPLNFHTATRLDHPGGVPTYSGSPWPFPGAFVTYPAAPSNTVDGGIIALDPGIRAAWGMLSITDGPLPFATKSEVVLGMTIYKAGRTTGRVPPALGTIISLSAAADVDYGDTYRRLPGWEQYKLWDPFEETLGAIFTGQMVFSSAYEGDVTNLPGDSGSVVLGLIGGQFKIIGLFFAGSGVEFGTFTPIWTVAKALQVEAYDDVTAHPAPSAPRWFFGVACDPAASPSSTLVEAVPDAGAPVDPVYPAAGSLVLPVRHRPDAMQVIPSRFELTHGAGVVRLGKRGFHSHWGCFVFEGAAIPLGTTVTSAFLELTISPDVLHDRRLFNPAGSTVQLSLRAGMQRDAFRPLDFSNWDTYNRTDAAVGWTIAADTPAPGDVLTSPDLSAVLQEVLSREDWVPGGGLMLRLTDETSGWASLLVCGLGPDADPAHAPRLHVEWA